MMFDYHSLDIKSSVILVCLGQLSFVSCVCLFLEMISCSALKIILNWILCLQYSCQAFFKFCILMHVLFFEMSLM